MASRECPICLRYDRTEIETAYLIGDRQYDFRPFSRAQVERHVSHTVDPDALRMSMGMASATAIAGRLRHLESATTTILDAAMRPTVNENGVEMLSDPKLALAAIKEARATIELTARVAGSLIDRHAEVDTRPDLDAAIADALRARNLAPSPPHDAAESAAEPAAEPARPAPEQLALMPAAAPSEP